MLIIKQKRETHEGRIRCPSLTMDPRELGFVRRAATMIGAAFVACALVYLVARLVVVGF
jgi:hypothetical protein